MAQTTRKKVFALWRYGSNAFRRKSGRNVSTVYLDVRTKLLGNA